jgi:uncharacterized membrane protein YdjX (TVP38/TMEM64 family)
MSVPAGKVMIGAILGFGLLCCLIPEVRDAIGRIASPDQVAGAARRLGPWVVVAVMALAIVVSPIPSGPVAMAAGAVYGTVWGGVLSGFGAILGAVIAFNLSRHLGRGAVALLPGGAAKWVCKPRSQGALMALVFVSRLIPVISFDAVSYAAGLTNLTQGRFAVATASGVMPMAFVFAGMGTRVVAGSVAVVAGACLVTVVLPVVIWLIRRPAIRRPDVLSSAG